jgi:tetratricopeptide (TPR) repeat protein
MSATDERIPHERTPEEWIQEGNRLMDDEQYEEAREAFQAAIDLDETVSEAWRGRGLARWNLNEQADAHEDFLQAISLDPSNAKAWENTGVSFWHRGQYEEALDAVEEAIDIDPENASFHYTKGFVLESLGLIPEAIEALRTACRLDPESVEYLLKLEELLHESSRYADALEVYNRITELCPDDAATHYNRGTALFKLQRYQQAVDAYDRAIKLRPDDAATHHNRGTALFQLQRYQQAVDAYDRAIKLRPDDATTHYNRGNALVNLGRYQEAVDAYDRVIKLRPDDAATHYNRGTALDKLERYQEALDAYDRAIELRPDHADTHHNRGNALFQLQRYQEALDAYDRAIKLRPDDADTHHNRGNALVNLGRYQEAVDAYDRAIKLRPDYAETHHNRGTALFNLQRYRSALTAFVTATKHDPELAQVWHARSVVSQQLEQTDDAHRCRLRIVYLADHASDPEKRHAAQKKLPSVIQTLASRRAAPLLLSRLVTETGLTGVFLRNASRVAEAFESSAPFRILDGYYAWADVDRTRRHRTLGVLALALGDPFEALRHFEVLDDDPATELLAARPLAACLHEMFREEDAAIVLDVGCDSAHATLQRAVEGEAVAPEMLYEAGQLLYTSDENDRLPALKAFRRAAEAGHLPALYMQALTAGEIHGTESPECAEAVRAVLREEKARASGGRSGPGFLRFENGTGAATPSRDAEASNGTPSAETLSEDLESNGTASDEPERGHTVSREDVDALVRQVEAELLHATRTVELQDARLAVLEWAERHAGDVAVSASGSGPATASVRLGTAPSRAAVDPAALSSVRDWTHRSRALRRLEDVVEEQRQNADLVRDVEVRLGEHDVPHSFYTDPGTPTAFVETLGTRVRNDRAGDQLRMHRDLLTYLTLSRRISAHHALSLLAYLHLAAQEAGKTEILDKAIDYGVAQTFLAGGTLEGLKMAGISLGIFGSPVMIGTAAVTCCLLTKFVQSLSSGPLPPYQQFHEALYSDLAGQADAVHDQVHLFLEQIQQTAARQSR